VTFDSLGLAPDLLRAVSNEGYTEPTPVQREAIPYVLAGRDVLAAAQTGTGKTAAFVLPLLQLLGGIDPGSPAPGARPAGRGPIRALVLTPTRELALQVEESVRTYGAQRPVRSTIVYGGVGFDPQVRALRAGPEIVVATPGRLLDHVGQRTIDLSHVEILVLDEADRMLDMGFIRDIRKILALLPARRQNLLFSATFSDEIRRLAGDILRDPAFVQVSPRNTAPTLVSQLVHPVDRERKRELLSHLVKTRRIQQALVFTRTKHGANRLAQQLDRDGIEAAAIHGNKSQPQRVRALNDFKAGRVSVLVATDIAARGLDIESLPHVVNYELPMVPEDYVHRIGRTGRAGIDGEAISLVCVDEARLLRDIEQLLRQPIPQVIVPGFEPDARIRAEPIRQRSGGGQRPVAGQRPAAAHRPSVGPRPSVGRPAPTPVQRAAVRPSAAPGPHIPQPRPAPANPGRGGGQAGYGSGPGRPAGMQRRGRGATGGPSIGNGPRPVRADPRPTGPGGQRHAGGGGTQRPQGHAGDRPFTALPGERLARAGGRPAGDRRP
jgi:ATP-dependent RNA helicase RhlE